MCAAGQCVNVRKEASEEEILMGADGWARASGGVAGVAHHHAAAARPAHALRAQGAYTGLSQH